MKLVKKLLTIAIALMMVLGLGTRVMAADDDPVEPTPAPTYDYPLTISGLDEGDVVHFYKIVEWVGETDDDDDSVVAGWKAVTPFATVLEADGESGESVLYEMLVGIPATEQDVEDGKAEEVGDLIPTGITAELAGQLAKLIENYADPVEIEVEEGATSVEFENPSAGLWMALITPADPDTVYNPVFVGADYNLENSGDWDIADPEVEPDQGQEDLRMTYSDKAAAKKSVLTLTKTASVTEDGWDDGNVNTTAVGDTISFTVKTTIPGYGTVYENPHFVLTDELTALKLKKDNSGKYIIHVMDTFSDPVDLTEDEDYTLEATDTGYTISFTEEYLKKVIVPRNITVSYSAIVTSDAEKAVNEEDNEVYIEYSHDPSDENDYDVKKDTTQHYTFSLDAEGAGAGETVTGKKTSEIVKIGLDAAGNPIKTETQTSEITSTEKWEGPLQGAVFGLFTDAAGTEPYKAKNADGTDGTTPLTATTGPDGRMNFKGLDAGTYYLKELSAPAGYVTDSTVHKVEIIAEVETVKVVEDFYDGKWSSAEDYVAPVAPAVAKQVTYKTEILKSYTVTIDGDEVAKYTFTNAATANSTEINWETAELVEKPYQFKNIQGTELPSTGGMGTTLFYTIGGMLVIGAGILLVSRRRMAE